VGKGQGTRTWLILGLQHIVTAIFVVACLAVELQILLLAIERMGEHKRSARIVFAVRVFACSAVRHPNFCGKGTR
jgi:hypothetical protein